MQCNAADAIIILKVGILVPPSSSPGNAIISMLTHVSLTTQHLFVMEALLADEDVKGCFSCNEEEPIDSQLGVILASVPFSPGMADYIPIQVFPPPQQLPESAPNLDLPEPVPSQANSNPTLPQAAYRGTGI